MKKPKNYSSSMDELKSFTAYLNGMLEDGSFYRLSFRERYLHIKKVKQLYNELRGPVTDVSLRRLLPVAAVAALVMPIPMNSEGTATPASFLMGCTFDTSQTSGKSMVVNVGISTAATTMTSLELTVSGPEMSTITETYSGDATTLAIEVPAGEDRTFELRATPDPAERSEVMRYRGASTVDLYPGVTESITLTMSPDPIEPYFAAPVENPEALGLADDMSDLSYRYVTPTLGDLDDDGDLDLLLGTSKYYNDPGEFRYLENQGSASSADFSDVSNNPNPYGLVSVSYPVAPRLVDIDGDGDLDLFAADNNHYIMGLSNDLQYFKNSGSQSSPQFDTSVSEQSASAVEFPTFGDLDGDGDLDLLLGSTYYSSVFVSEFRYHENTGDSTSWNFAAASVDPYNLTGVPDYAAPVLVDLDGDGDLDILVGDNAGDLHYYENIGTPSSPSFAAPQTNLFGLSNAINGSKATIAVGDLDLDGDTDVLVGESYSGGASLYYFENQAID